MSRRYAASERVRTWSDEYMCTVSVIPGRELVHHFDPLPVPESPAERMEFIRRYLLAVDEATMQEIGDALNMSKSIVRLTLLAHVEVFQMRNGRGKQGPVNLWSLRGNHHI